MAYSENVRGLSKLYKVCLQNPHAVKEIKMYLKEYIGEEKSYTFKQWEREYDAILKVEPEKQEKKGSS